MTKPKGPRNSRAKHKKPSVSAAPDAPRRTPKHGRGQLLTGGVPGNRGGGRPPNLFRELCRELATGDLTIGNLRKILETKNPEKRFSQFVPALKYVTENGYGRPTERHELTGADGGPVKVETTQVWKFGDKEIQF